MDANEYINNTFIKKLLYPKENEFEELSQLYYVLEYLSFNEKRR